jgi:hypothetical protein
MKLFLPTKLIKHTVGMKLSFLWDAFGIKKIIRDKIVSSDFTRAWQDC